jgi:superfamily II DNA or RNA helicase
MLYADRMIITDLEKVNLIVFDECHRGVDDQPMRQVMKTFHSCLEPPRILGLTATLLNGNCKLGKVMDEVRALETTYHSKVATVDGLDAVVGCVIDKNIKKKIYHGRFQLLDKSARTVQVL